MGMKVREFNFSLLGGYGGIEWIPYQLAIGLSLRGFEWWAVRLYLGPLKLWFGWGA
jgi:hypothetical protein